MDQKPKAACFAESDQRFSGAYLVICISIQALIICLFRVKKIS
jgi:hypothetical protein